MSERTFGCSSGHRFDLAKHGYLTLLDPRAPKTIGDDRAMLDARATLLASGAYAPIANAVANAVGSAFGGTPTAIPPGGLSGNRADASSAPSEADRPADVSGVARDASAFDQASGAEADREHSPAGSRSGPLRTSHPLSIADLGCGTGYYAAAVVTRVPTARLLAADRSADAVRMTLRTLDGRVDTTGIVLDLWRPLPLRNDSADVLLDVFAPRNPVEYARVLRSGGALIVVVPTGAHLGELRASAGLLDVPDGKDARVADQFAAVGLALETSTRVEYVIATDASTRDLITGMGPSAHHRANGHGSAETRAVAETSAPDGDADARSGPAADPATQPVTVSVDVLTLRAP